MLNDQHSLATAEPTRGRSQVRMEVLSQHEGLRDLLGAALAATSAPEKGRENLLEIAHLAHEIRRRFRAHLTFEERVLVPILSGVDGWGPPRVRDLVSEHTHQRLEIDAVIQAIEGGMESAQIANALRSLAADLVRDMDEEERDYLGPELLRDDILFTD
jgi:hypothetical protein